MIDLNNSFVLKHQKELHDISVMEFTGSLSRLGRTAIAMNIANKITPEAYIDYLNKTMSNISSIQVEPDYLHDFFRQVYSSPLVDESKFAIAFRSDEDIEKIRPEYLSTIVGDMGETIRKILASTTKESDIKKMVISGEYESKLKKQLVKTSLVLNGTRDLLVLDSPPIVKIDKFFIQNNILPFLASYGPNTEELLLIAKKSVGRISDLTRSMNALFASLDQSIQSGKIPDDKINLIGYYIFNMKTITMRLCAYLTSMVIRKMAFYSFNITACMELYNSFSELFPEMENILHESAMDGDLTDIDNDTLMQGVISGSLSVIRPHIQKVVGMKKLEVSNAMCQKFNRKIDFISGFDANNEHPYNAGIYKAVNKSFLDIIKNLHTFEIQSKDTEAVVDDIISASDLSETFTSKYEKLIAVVSDISCYDAHGDESAVSDMMMSLFNDLLHYENNVGIIVTAMSKGYQYLDALMKSFDVNDYGLQDAAYNEIKAFLDTTMKNYKEYVIRIVRNLLERLDNMTEALSFAKIVPDDDMRYDCTEDYSLECYAAAYDEADAISEAVFESLLMEYNKQKVMRERGVRLVYEADTNTSTEPTVKTDAQQQHTDSTTNKTTTTNTENNNQQQTSNTNNNQGDKKSILDKFREFIDSILQKFRDKSAKLTGKNNKWLANVKQDILSLDMSNTNISLAKYEELVPETILNDIRSASSKISTLNVSALPTELKKPGSKAEFFLFNRIPEKVGNETSFPARIKRYYTYGNTTDNELATYSGDEAKNQVTNMIAFCEKYSTFYQQISDSIKKLSDTAYKKQNEIIQSNASAQQKNQQEGDNETGSNNVITGATRDYTGAILTVLEKKYTDYIKVLSKLAPANKSSGQNQPDTTTDQNDDKQQNNGENNQDNK